MQSNEVETQRALLDSPIQREETFKAYKLALKDIFKEGSAKAHKTLDIIKALRFKEEIYWPDVKDEIIATIDSLPVESNKTLFEEQLTSKFKNLFEQAVAFDFCLKIFDIANEHLDQTLADEFTIEIRVALAHENSYTIPRSSIEGTMTDSFETMGVAKEKAEAIRSAVLANYQKRFGQKIIALH